MVITQSERDGLAQHLRKYRNDVRRAGLKTSKHITRLRSWVRVYQQAKREARA